MPLGEGHCVVIDASNHAVKADAAKGLASFDEYAAGIDNIHVEGKFKQLLSTIGLAVAGLYSTAVRTFTVAPSSVEV